MLKKKEYTYILIGVYMIQKAIQYYYNLYPDQINQIEKNTYSFYLNGFMYYFELQKRAEEELKAIYELNNKTQQYNNLVLNRFQKIGCVYNGQSYVLIQVVKPIRNLQLSYILNTVHLQNDKKYALLIRSDWKRLWENKIDNIEYQQKHIEMKHPIIDESIGYFIGMSEAAISYLEEIRNKEYNLFVSHERVNVEETTLEYFNPQNIIIDNRVRDMAEYLKSIFLNGEYDYNTIQNFLIKAQLLEQEAKLLFCRLIYPSYYFDSYDQILIGNTSRSMDGILKKTFEYKEYVKYIFNLLSQKYQIKKIAWISN